MKFLLNPWHRMIGAKNPHLQRPHKGRSLFKKEALHFRLTSLVTLLVYLISSTPSYAANPTLTSKSQLGIRVNAEQLTAEPWLTSRLNTLVERLLASRNPSLVNYGQQIRQLISEHPSSPGPAAVVDLTTEETRSARMKLEPTHISDTRRTSIQAALASLPGRFYHQMTNRWPSLALLWEIMRDVLGMLLKPPVFLMVSVTAILVLIGHPWLATGISLGMALVAQDPLHVLDPGTSLANALPAQVPLCRDILQQYFGDEAAHLSNEEVSRLLEHDANVNAILHAYAAALGKPSRAIPEMAEKITQIKTHYPYDNAPFYTALLTRAGFERDGTPLPEETVPEAILDSVRIQPVLGRKSWSREEKKLLEFSLAQVQNAFRLSLADNAIKRLIGFTVPLTLDSFNNIRYNGGSSIQKASIPSLITMGLYQAGFTYPLTSMENLTVLNRRAIHPEASTLPSLAAAAVQQYTQQFIAQILTPEARPVADKLHDQETFPEHILVQAMASLISAQAMQEFQLETTSPSVQGATLFNGHTVADWLFSKGKALWVNGKYKAPDKQVKHLLEISGKEQWPMQGMLAAGMAYAYAESVTSQDKALLKAIQLTGDFAHEAKEISLESFGRFLERQASPPADKSAAVPAEALSVLAALDYLNQTNALPGNVILFDLSDEVQLALKRKLIELAIPFYATNQNLYSAKIDTKTLLITSKEAMWNTFLPTHFFSEAWPKGFSTWVSGFNFAHASAFNNPAATPFIDFRENLQKATQAGYLWSDPEEVQQATSLPVSVKLSNGHYSAFLPFAYSHDSHEVIKQLSPPRFRKNAKAADAAIQDFLNQLPASLRPLLFRRLSTVISTKPIHPGHSKLSRPIPVYFKPSVVLQISVDGIAASLDPKKAIVVGNRFAALDDEDQIGVLAHESFHLNRPQFKNLLLKEAAATWFGFKVQQLHESGQTSQLDFDEFLYRAKDKINRASALMLAILAETLKNRVGETLWYQAIFSGRTEPLVKALGPGIFTVLDQLSTVYESNPFTLPLLATHVVGAAHLYHDDNALFFQRLREKLAAAVLPDQGAFLSDFETALRQVTTPKQSQALWSKLNAFMQPFITEINTFADWLKQELAFASDDPDSWTKALAQAARVSQRTARAWLAGQHLPEKPQFDRLVEKLSVPEGSVYLGNALLLQAKAQHAEALADTITFPRLPYQTLDITPVDNPKASFVPHADFELPRLITATPDGRYTLVLPGDATLRVVETETGKLVSQLECHNLAAPNLCFIPGEEPLVAMGGDDHIARIYNYVTGELKAELKDNLSGILWSVAASADRKLMATDLSGRTTLWDISKKSAIVRYSGKPGFHSPATITLSKLVTDRAGTHVTLNLKDPPLSLMVNYRRSESKHRYLLVSGSSHASWATPAMISRGVIYIISKSNTAQPVGKSQKFSFQDPDNECLIQIKPNGTEHPIALPDLPAILKDVSLNDNTQMLLTGVCIRTKRPLMATLPNHSTSMPNHLVRNLNSDFSASRTKPVLATEKLIIVAGSSGKIAVYDRPSHDLVYVLQHAANGSPEQRSLHITNMAVSEDNQHFVTQDNTGSVYLWDLKAGSLLWQHKIEISHVSSTSNLMSAFSPDGKFIALEDMTHSIYVINAKTGRVVNRFDGHTKPVVHLVFSDPNNSLLVIDVSGKSTIYSLVNEAPESYSGIVVSRSQRPESENHKLGFAYDPTSWFIHYKQRGEHWIPVREIKAPTSLTSAELQGPFAFGFSKAALYLWHTATGEQILSIPAGNAAHLSDQPNKTLAVLTGNNQLTFYQGIKAANVPAEKHKELGMLLPFWQALMTSLRQDEQQAGINTLNTSLAAGGQEMDRLFALSHFFQAFASGDSDAAIARLFFNLLKSKDKLKAMALDLDGSRTKPGSLPQTLERVETFADFRKNDFLQTTITSWQAAAAGQSAHRPSLNKSKASAVAKASRPLWDALMKAELKLAAIKTSGFVNAWHQNEMEALDTQLASELIRIVNHLDQLFTKSNLPKKWYLAAYVRRALDEAIHDLAILKQSNALSNEHNKLFNQLEERGTLSADEVKIKERRLAVIEKMLSMTPDVPAAHRQFLASARAVMNYLAYPLSLLNFIGLQHELAAEASQQIEPNASLNGYKLHSNYLPAIIFFAVGALTNHPLLRLGLLLVGMAAVFWKLVPHALGPPVMMSAWDQLRSFLSQMPALFRPVYAMAAMAGLGLILAAHLSHALSWKQAALLLLMMTWGSLIIPSTREEWTARASEIIQATTQLHGDHMLATAIRTDDWRELSQGPATDDPSPAIVRRVMNYPIFAMTFRDEAVFSLALDYAETLLEMSDNDALITSEELVTKLKSSRSLALGLDFKLDLLAQYFSAKQKALASQSEKEGLSFSAFEKWLLDNLVQSGLIIKSEGPPAPRYQVNPENPAFLDAMLIAFPQGADDITIRHDLLHAMMGVDKSLFRKIRIAWELLPIEIQYYALQVIGTLFPQLKSRRHGIWLKEMAGWFKQWDELLIPRLKAATNSPHEVVKSTAKVLLQDIDRLKAFSEKISDIYSKSQVYRRILDPKPNPYWQEESIVEDWYKTSMDDKSRVRLYSLISTYFGFGSANFLRMRTEPQERNAKQVNKEAATSPVITDSYFSSASRGLFILYEFSTSKPKTKNLENGLAQLPPLTIMTESSFVRFKRAHPRLADPIWHSILAIPDQDALSVSLQFEFTPNDFDMEAVKLLVLKSPLLMKYLSTVFAESHQWLPAGQVTKAQIAKALTLAVQDRDFTRDVDPLVMARLSTKMRALFRRLQTFPSRVSDGEAFALNKTVLEYLLPLHTESPLIDNKLIPLLSLLRRKISVNKLSEATAASNASQANTPNVIIRHPQAAILTILLMRLGLAEKVLVTLPSLEDVAAQEETIRRLTGLNSASLARRVRIIAGDVIPEAHRLWLGNDVTLLTEASLLNKTDEHTTLPSLAQDLRVTQVLISGAGADDANSHHTLTEAGFDEQPSWEMLRKDDRIPGTQVLIFSRRSEATLPIEWEENPARLAAWDQNLQADLDRLVLLLQKRNDLTLDEKSELGYLINRLVSSEGFVISASRKGENSNHTPLLPISTSSLLHDELPYHAA